MEPFEPRAAHGPEFYIQNRWVEFLEAKKWHVERLIGNAFQSGIPDLLLAHKKYGQRWVDIKVYDKYSLTKAQRAKWPIWESFGVGIWILGAKSPEDCTKAHMIREHDILFRPPNWREFWNPRWDQQPDIDELLEEVDNADSKMPPER